MLLTGVVALLISWLPPRSSPTLVLELRPSDSQEWPLTSFANEKVGWTVFMPEEWVFFFTSATSVWAPPPTTGWLDHHSLPHAHKQWHAPLVKKRSQANRHVASKREMPHDNWSSNRTKHGGPSCPRPQLLLDQRPNGKRWVTMVSL